MSSEAGGKTHGQQHHAAWSKYAIPPAVGIAWLAVLQYRHMMRRNEAQPGVRVEGPFWIYLYAMLPFRAISRAWGWMNDLTVPEFLRGPLYRTYSSIFGCNLDEMRQENLLEYRNLAEFFYRELKPGARPIAGPERAALVSPADGKVLHFGKVESDGSIEQVKGLTYSVNALLGPSEVSGGAAAVPAPGNSLFQAVIYLAPGDYHRFHSPADWRVGTVRHFAAELFSVSPMLARVLNHLFVLNERVVMLGRWKHGFFSMIPVGATNVGSIRINMCPDLATNLPESELPLGVYDHAVAPQDVARGAEMGGFRLGSTVVLVFEAPSSFEFAIAEGQKLRVGEPLGRWPVAEFPSVNMHSTAVPTADSVKLPAAYTHPFDVSKPHFPSRLRVEFGSADFSSKLVVAAAVAQGEAIAPIRGTTQAAKAWTSVQIAKDTHIELNSELVYMNHSCNPSAIIDTANMQVVATRALRPGDEVTFFYPSTEWDMSQPFVCWCGAERCLRRIRGARYIPRAEFGDLYLAPHILDLIAEREASGVTDEQLRAADAAQ
ncbi:phosphatidylserine decarboxylase 1 [Polyrhizophydium stewartii]|uniref:Phosphatidylserine decarboxylase proenzyme 1, mitochondrial n=1 Tax=Polyrhizophydium stewartii TaxID=2732419 RepID=A0ABR4MXT7_9FUNG